MQPLKILALVLLVVGVTRTAAAEEPVIGGPCEGCELVFVGMPASLAPRARIAPPDEPGGPMRIEGRVTDHAGNPVPEVIVYAYHTDADGVYPRGSTRHGRLRGWAVTDADGTYCFDTIRPGGYPGSTIPQHVHMHLVEPGYATYWIDSIEFEDDPRLTRSRRSQASTARGGSGLVDPKRNEDGVWLVHRDIELGRGVPGHRAGPDGSS